MTVDEILATGRYTDRRGRMWAIAMADGRWGRTDGRFLIGGAFFSVERMRLLIERDMHRDECPGLQFCMNHPVPYVWIGGSGFPFHDPAGGFNDGALHSTLPEAMDAARALAARG